MPLFMTVGHTSFAMGPICVQHLTVITQVRYFAQQVRYFGHTNINEPAWLSDETPEVYVDIDADLGLIMVTAEHKYRWSNISVQA